MDGSDFRAPPPASSLLHLSAGARLPRTDARISLVTTCSPCQARHGLGPRGVGVPLTLTRHALLPARGTNPSALSNGIFGAPHLQGRHNPLPLHLACFRAYASTRLLPAAPQGSILGSRLTITQAGLSPARTRGLARPHSPPFALRSATTLVPRFAPLRATATSRRAPKGAVGLRHGPPSNGLTAYRMRLHLASAASGHRDFAPLPRRPDARADAYRGLPAFASLSMAGSGSWSRPARSWNRSRNAATPTDNYHAAGLPIHPHRH